MKRPNEYVMKCQLTCCRPYTKYMVATGQLSVNDLRTAVAASWSEANIQKLLKEIKAEKAVEPKKERKDSYGEAPDGSDEVPHVCMNCNAMLGLVKPDDPKRYEGTCQGCKDIPFDAQVPRDQLQEQDEIERLHGSPGTALSRGGTGTGRRSAAGGALSALAATTYRPDDSGECQGCFETSAEQCRCAAICERCGSYVGRCGCSTEDDEVDELNKLLSINQRMSIRAKKVELGEITGRKRPGRKDKMDSWTTANVITNVSSGEEEPF